MRNTTVKNIVLSGLMMALGMILPFITGQIPQMGNMFLPMHFPVLLCGLICGWKYGGGVGFILPILRFMVFGMPPLFPIGIAMAFELMTYGLVIGILYERLPKKIHWTYVSLIVAMILGRLVWGIAQVILLGLSGGAFSMSMFVGGAFLNAIPGIILQLILIPIIMAILHKRQVVYRN